MLCLLVQHYLPVYSTYCGKQCWYHTYQQELSLYHSKTLKDWCKKQIQRFSFYRTVLKWNFFNTHLLQSWKGYILKELNRIFHSLWISWKMQVNIFCIISNKWYFNKEKCFCREFQTIWLAYWIWLLCYIWTFNVNQVWVWIKVDNDNM